jgi:hypothetical protein
MYEVVQNLDEAMKYCQYYKQDKRTKVYRNLLRLHNNRSSMLDQAADIMAVSNKAKTIALKKSNKLNQERRQRSLDQFTGGGVLYDPMYTGVYLSTDGETLRTTNNIKVEFHLAHLLYNRWSKGGDILGAKLDYYTVVKANSKSVQIGCTLISASELHRMFKDY